MAVFDESGRFHRATSTGATSRPVNNAPPDLHDIRVHAAGYDLSVLTARNPVQGGTPIIYLAGFIVGGHSAEPLTAELARTHRVYAPDLPGYADSDGPGRTLTQPEQADVIDMLMDALNETTAVLVANSFGAQIAVEFAVRHPGRVERLVLIGPGVDSHGRTPFHQLVRFIRNSRLEDAWVQGMSEDYFKSGPRRIIETAWYALRNHLEERLPLIATPTLVVRGAEDLIVPHRWVEELTSSLRNGKLLEIPNYAHGVERVGAPALAQVIRNYLAEAP